MEACKVNARFGNNGNQPGDKIQRFENDVRGAVTPGKIFRIIAECQLPYICALQCGKHISEAGLLSLYPEQTGVEHMTEVLRQQLIDTALAMNASGLNQGASGNLSVRCEQSKLITPSCMDYTGLIPEDIVWMDFDGISRGL